MRRVPLLVAAFAAAAALPLASAQAPGAWATLKGRVVFPADQPIPVRAPLVVNQDQKHCLSKGPILDEDRIVDPKTRGIRNVVVWLRPDAMDPKAKLKANEIHPDDAKRQPATVVIDQPCCMFTPRVTAARVGDLVEVKNPAPVAHNFFWGSQQNGNFNVILPPGQPFKFPNPLAAESAPIQYKCTIHPWMLGYVRIFDHPYYAVTGDDGTFTIPNAPVGTYRLVVWHEKVGFLGGAPGRFGTPVVIKGGGTELPVMPYTELAK